MVETFYEVMRRQGITRRSFLKYCSLTAASLGLGPAFVPRIAARTPAGRWGDPEELGAAAVYLASRASGFTTASVLTVDGGLTAAI